jgi:hypothetical protein
MFTVIRSTEETGFVPTASPRVSLPLTFLVFLADHPSTYRTAGLRRGPSPENPRGPGQPRSGSDPGTVHRRRSSTAHSGHWAPRAACPADAGPVPGPQQASGLAYSRKASLSRASSHRPAQRSPCGCPDYDLEDPTRKTFMPPRTQRSPPPKSAAGGIDEQVPGIDRCEHRPMDHQAATLRQNRGSARADRSRPASSSPSFTIGHLYRRAPPTPRALRPRPGGTGSTTPGPGGRQAGRAQTGRAVVKRTLRSSTTRRPSSRYSKITSRMLSQGQSSCRRAGPAHSGEHSVIVAPPRGALVHRTNQPQVA